MSVNEKPAINFAGIASMLPVLVGLSLLSNLSILISPLFMMQVFNRVVATGNLNTLALLILVAAIALTGIAVTDLMKERAMAAAGFWLGHRVATARGTTANLPQVGNRQDSDAVQSYLIGGGLGGALSLIWLPIYILVLGALHPLLALVALGFGFLLLGLSELGRRLTHSAQGQAYSRRAEAAELAGQLALRPELAAAMGVGANILTRRDQMLVAALEADWQAHRRKNDLSSLTGLLRNLAQIAMLSTGAVLLVTHGLTAGASIAATLIGAKVLMTIETAARTLVDTRNFLATLKRIRGYGDESAVMRTDIANLSGAILADNLIVPRGPGAPPRLDRVTFSVGAGECLAILGEAGSGKTTLLHALCGVEHAPIGAVRYDQSDIRTLPADRMNEVVGYLPQGVSMLRGTIADNISRWAPDRNDEKIVDAARMAGVHGFISSLPRAYETQLPADAHLISPGQSQRIALARAFYSKPRFLFLDEPNALLDTTGERFIFEALSRMKSEGCTIVMSMHRGGIIGLADKVLLIDRGKISDFGPRREVLERLDRGGRQVHLPVTAAAADDLADWISTQFRRIEDADLKQKSIQAAVELFNFARVNGPNSANRRLTACFKFVDDITCSITLSEPRRTQLQAKIEGVRSRLRDPGRPPTDLPPDEVSLAKVLQTAHSFEFQSADKSSAFIATLKSHASPPQSLH